MRKFIVGVIGNGVVGSATARAFIEHCEVRVYDSDQSRSRHFLNHVLKSDIIFICLPEAVVASFFLETDNIPPKATFVIKSTMPIGTTRRLKTDCRLENLLHSPEFLTERCATLDAQMPTRNIIGVPGGGHYPAGSVSQGTPCGDCFGRYELQQLYKERWPYVPIHVMTSDESEAVKLIQNGFFAVKVAFWNEMYSLSEKLGLHWGTVRQAILADGRIHPNHTQVPGPDGKRGFGGKCLPKDLEMLADLCGELQVSTVNDACVTYSALRRNKYMDRREAQS